MNTPNLFKKVKRALQLKPSEQKGERRQGQRDEGECNWHAIVNTPKLVYMEYEATVGFSAEDNYAQGHISKGLF